MSALALARRLHTGRGWAVFGALALVGLVVIPTLTALFLRTRRSPCPSRVIALLGKFTCYALAAIALDLIWGFAGMLSLGHGVFFALGGYAMGMYLMLAIRGQGVYRSNLPDFMVFLDWKALPWFWHAVFDHFGVRGLRRALGAGCSRTTSATSRSARASVASTSRSSRKRSPTR